MAYTLNKTETDFCRDYGHSLGRAENAFIELLANIADISEDDAAKVFALYAKEKLIKFDRCNSRFAPKHGGFLDKDVILRALAA